MPVHIFELNEDFFKYNFVFLINLHIFWGQISCPTFILFTKSSKPYAYSLQALCLLWALEYNSSQKIRRAKNLFQLHQKWCLFTAGSLEKDTVFGAVETNLGISYFR